MLFQSSDITTLDSLLNWWERAEYLAEAFVILGCIGEFIAEFTKIGTEGWRRQLSKVSLLVLISALVFALIALTRTNRLSGREIALLNGVSADARIRAANAEANVKGLDLEIKEAERGTADAQAMAESERLERIRLETIVAPRSLSLDQQRLIAAVCARFRGQGVLVSSYGLDGEGAALGGQIISVLRSAGIIVADGRSSIIVTGGFETGVHVRGPDLERDLVSTLGNALSSIGKLQVAINDAIPRLGSAISGGGQGFPPGSVFVTVTVGTKPVPILPVK